MVQPLPPPPQSHAHLSRAAGAVWSSAGGGRDQSVRRLRRRGFRQHSLGERGRSSPGRRRLQAADGGSEPVKPVRLTIAGLSMEAPVRRGVWMRDRDAGIGVQDFRHGTTVSLNRPGKVTDSDSDCVGGSGMQKRSRIFCCFVWGIIVWGRKQQQTSCK
eukprot:scaffold8363_cov91-Isochrysis_galbana.AAC.4